MFLMIFSYPLKLHNFEELNSLREKSEWKNLEKPIPNLVTTVGMEIGETSFTS